VLLSCSGVISKGLLVIPTAAAEELWALMPSTTALLFEKGLFVIPTACPDRSIRLEEWSIAP
jgi:hypothetical protein